jgi:hypothetical protein
MIRVPLSEPTFESRPAVAFRSSHPAFRASGANCFIIRGAGCSAAQIVDTAALRAEARCATLSTDGVKRQGRAMSHSDAGYNFDRYRRLLAEADDEPKRLAFINLLIEEKAKDKLAVHSLRARLSGLGLKNSSEAGEPNR